MKLLKKALKSGFGQTRRNTQHDEDVIHFLHIGKCAGSQIDSIAQAMQSQSDTVRIIKHPHHVSLKDIPRHEKYFFSIRDPISRFKSGFYSRKRWGRPRYDYKWSAGEELAFSEFEHANDLAEALFCEGRRGQQAFMAIKSIQHTSQNQIDWFCQNGDLFINRPPVCILRTAHFASDLARLSHRIGVDLAAFIDDANDQTVVRHTNDYSDSPYLTELAQSNLRKWYTQDYEFYRHCEHWISTQDTDT